MIPKYRYFRRNAYGLEIKGKKRIFGKKINFFHVIPKYRYFRRNVYGLAIKRKKRIFDKKRIFGKK